MYSSSLRHLPAWAPVVPHLASPQGLNLQETRLTPQHITLALPTSTEKSANRRPRSLHILLLDASSFSSSQHEQTTTQLHRFASLSRDADIAIVFLFQQHTGTESRSPPLRAYTTVLAYIRADPGLLSLPVIPLGKAEDLAATLTEYGNAVARRGVSSLPDQSDESAARAARSLLPHATTASVPLSHQEVNKITKAFVSMKELAEVAVTDEARGRVREALNQEESEVVIDFWKEEWIAE